MAQALAVFGLHAALRDVAALSELDLEETGRAIDALAHEGILDRREALGFAHPLIRTVVYEALPARRRAKLHGQAAGILIDAGADPEAIAAHLRLTDPAGDARSVRCLRDAAAAAIRRGAPPAAVAYLQRALAESRPRSPSGPRCFASWRIAETLIRSPASIEHLRAALLASEDTLEQVRLRASLSEALLFAGEWDQAQTMLLEAIEEAKGSDPDLLLRLEGRLITLGTLDGPGGAQGERRGLWPPSWRAPRRISTGHVRCGLTSRCCWQCARARLLSCCH